MYSAFKLDPNYVDVNLKCLGSSIEVTNNRFVRISMED